ncbi:MAG TPA: 50S ribosomal protein L21 [Terriglobales bacterium]|nr:50S ribosomal protein L21 [Terriglobales bacterium]
MYAVIRAGGKQYRVAPGDVIRVERAGHKNGRLEFDVLAVSAAEGQISRGNGASVVGQVVEEGRGAKVMVFHYKRKKQYKKLAGHRQPFTAVRITEIAFEGQKFTAPELPEKKVKAPKPKPETVPAVEAEATPAAKKAEHKAKAKKEAKPKAEAHEKKAAAPKAAAKHKASKPADKGKKKK